ncbi:MAG: FixH family protein [Prolixibacteraceae bacterium]
MRIYNTSWWILGVFLLVFISCDKDNEEPSGELNFLSITESVTDNNLYKISLLSDDTLFHGYNHIYLSIVQLSDNQKVTDAKIVLYPEMDMITMRHSAPKEDPLEMADDNGLFDAAVVFIMPDTDDMKWRIKVNVESAGVADSVWLTIPKVKSLAEPKIINFISAADGTTKYFVSLVEPFDPKVGINDFEVAVHYKKTMMSFPADDDVSVMIDPQMPSMDHGSPNNVNPVLNENGHYKGKVNFTMTGWWRVYLDLEKSGEKLSNEAFIDITF